MSVNDIVMGAAGASSAPATYIEDVFSTYLYTGNGASNPITNGIDMAGKGGLVWFKNRTMSNNAGSVWNKGNHLLMDTARGVNSGLSSNLTNAAQTEANHLTSFNSNGFTLGANWSPNNFGEPWASWTFRKQPKFFDVVTYTGTGAQQNISHSLGSTPGFIVCKATSTTSDWLCWHRGDGSGVGSTFGDFGLNLTNAAQYPSGYGTPCNASTFNPHLVASGGYVNQAGVQYVAYLFAHNAGGFGLTGTDNVISCGSYTGAGYPGPVTVNLGWEPQWLLVKRTDSTSNWFIYDTMRGWPANNGSSSGAQSLKPNLSAAEGDTAYGGITSTGFQWFDSGDPNTSGATYIYIAIRRGPMKTPTTGTSVFYPQAYSDGALGSSNPTNLGASAGFPVDMFMHSIRQDPTFCSNIFDRLRGSDPALITSGTNAENTGEPLNAYKGAFDVMSGVNSAYNNRFYYYSALGRDHIAWMFRRAPGFFDVVCYTGTGVDFQTVKHNLGVAPELVIVKNRGTASTNWLSFASQAPGGTDYYGLRLNTNDSNVVNTSSASFTATTFLAFSNTALGLSSADNQTASGANYVAYLFASCPGVSKIGTYVGNGASNRFINCGFTGGARFVMIKPVTTSGTLSNWIVLDTARGMAAGNDKTLSLNNVAAEEQSINYLDTVSGGFNIAEGFQPQTNSSGQTYLYLAIA